MEKGGYILECMTIYREHVNVKKKVKEDEWESVIETNTETGTREEPDKVKR